VLGLTTYGRNSVLRAEPRSGSHLQNTHTHFRLTITQASLGYKRIAKLPFVTCASAEAKRARLLWPERHLEHCRQGRRQWHLEQMPYEDLQNLFHTLRQLHPREFDLLSAGFEVSYPETHRRVVNVTESIGRAKENPRALTPGMRQYLTDKCRLVTGLEPFLQQGLLFGNRLDSLAERFSDAFLCRLNAFHVWVAAVFFFARLRALAECASSVGGSRPSEEGAPETYQVQGELQNGPTKVLLPCGLDLGWGASSCADTDQGAVSDLAF
jgi:hypothetical protein